MTIDMCPFLAREQEAKPCPGCKISMSEARIKEHNETVSTCLTGIRDELANAAKTAKESKILPMELFKLRRLTATEEEQKLDITAKKNALEILDAIEKIDLPLGLTEEAQYHLDIGDVLFNLGEFEKALDKFILASKTEPKNKRVWNNIGVTMVRLGRVKEALAYYDKALDLDPAYGSAWFNKGKALFKLGMKKKALNCFRKATKHSPENKSAWNNLGVTLRHLKRFKESIRCYDKAIKIHSEYPWAWHNKGVALMELRRYKEAMQCFDKALQIDPNYEPAKESKRDLMRKVM